VISNLLAAIGGGLSGLGTGLQYNQQRKMAEDEASARRRSEALQALLTQDQLGLVPESAASPMPMVKPQLGVPQSGNVGEMLKALQSAPPAPTAAPDTRRRVSLPGVDGRVQEYVMDPTQSRDARNARMASDMEGQRYQRQRGDVLADRDTELQTAAQLRETANKRAYETARAAFPKNADLAQYRPDIDYAAIFERTDAMDRENRQFGRQVALQDRSFGQQTRLATMKQAGAADKPPTATEGERKNAGLLELARSAAPIIDTAPTPSRFERAAAGMGLNEVLDDQQQKVQQAGLMLADAYIRFTSGANAPETEVTRTFNMITPMPGDSDATRERKRQARQTVLRAMEIGAGRAGASVTPIGGDTNRTVPATGANPYR
jgi:hypothetical protein